MLRLDARLPALLVPVISKVSLLDAAVLCLRIALRILGNAEMPEQTRQFPALQQQHVLRLQAHVHVVGVT